MYCEAKHENCIIVFCWQLFKVRDSLLLSSEFWTAVLGNRNKKQEGKYYINKLQIMGRNVETVNFCYSGLHYSAILHCHHGREWGEPKTEVLILSSDNLCVCSCLYLSRAEVETLSTQNGWAWVSWWFMSSGDTLPPSFLPFPGEDMLVEWKYCSCVPSVWHRKGNCFFYQSVWRHRNGNTSFPTILFCTVCAAYMAHEEKVTRLDHSAVNNPVTKEKADDQDCGCISIKFLDPQARLKHIDWCEDTV